ncbi:SpoIIE family protein phosphatase [Streptomyces sp. NPDC085614]|uniref:SpoIIE family protein phosphatase n=1 Tax=Streptomyces sp. NPDC085614 TaxID=3365733 RepID=UPI0037D73907
MASDDALLVVDAAGVVVAWSRAAESLFGRGPAEAVGRPLMELLSGSWPWDDAGGNGPPRKSAGTPGLRVLPVTSNDDAPAWRVDLLGPTEDGGDALDQALLHALFTQSPIGMQVLDPQLNIVRANTAASGMSGLDRSEVFGRRLSEIFRLSDPDESVGIMREVLETGVPALERLVRVRTPQDPEHEHVYSVSVFRLQGPDGGVLGLSTAVVDVTVRERALARARVLSAVRERVGHTLQLDVTCAELVDVLVPAFADAAEVDLLDHVVRGEDPASGPVGLDKPLRRMAFASADGRRESLAVGTGPFRFPAAWVRCLTDLRPQLVTYQPEDLEPLPPHPWSSRTPTTPGLHSAIVTPLSLRGGVYGTLSLYRSPGRDAFVDADLDLSLEAAARASLHIDNACRYTREHTIAVTLQRRVLARPAASQDVVASAHFHQSTDAGGGWFDVFPLSGERVALTVGRVSGTGIHAAMVMGQLRTALHTLASLDLEPDELLARLDDTVTRLAAERAGLPPGDPLRDERLTADCLYGIYDPLGRGFAVAVAGNPPPLLAYPDGTTEVFDVPAAPALGDGEGAPFAVTRTGLPEGSVIALHTDAFLPMRSAGGKEGLDRLRQVLTDSRRRLDDLCAEAVRTAPASPPGTDAILLLVRTHTLDPSLVSTWDLPTDTAAVATARARTRRQLSAWNLDELSLATELIVSELATNAVRYGAPPLTLRLIRGTRTLTFEVSDSSRVSPRLHHAQTTDEGGRGLFICAELAQNWGVRFTDGHKTIWTEQSLPHPV